jgi:hypothetical protein
MSKHDPYSGSIWSQDLEPQATYPEIPDPGMPCSYEPSLYDLEGPGDSYEEMEHWAAYMRRIRAEAGETVRSAREEAEEVVKRVRQHFGG